MSRLLSAFFIMALATLADAQVQVSIGVRETGFAGGAFTSIGGNGGSTGGIEWINLDAQTLTLDGTWQLFTFNLTTDPITNFAGTSANGILEGTYGTFEHVRILNTGGQSDPITLWIDDITNTVTPSGSSPVPTNFGDFEGYPEGTAVMFQHPGYSGSTGTNVMAGSSTGVDNSVASRSSSNRFDFQFIDGSPTRWVRLTTYSATNIPNPLIRFDDASVITFWMRGGKKQEDLGTQGPGFALSEICGTGLNAGQSSTYYLSGAPILAPGAIFFSQPGLPDIPIAGGTLVSGGGLFLMVQITADPSGSLALPVPGSPAIVDLILQSVFLDTSLPQLFTFTNAIQARFGQ